VTTAPRLSIAGDKQLQSTTGTDIVPTSNSFRNEFLIRRSQLARRPPSLAKHSCELWRDLGVALAEAGSLGEGGKAKAERNEVGPTDGIREWRRMSDVEGGVR